MICPIYNMNIITVFYMINMNCPIYNMNIITVLLNDKQ